MDKERPSRILIVDDATENIDILATALSGYRKMIALNGERALKLAFSDNPPDLILLDINMPGMDGYEVCQVLKTNEKTREIPVIFLTANTDSESIVKGFEMGANDYLTKPFNIGEMLARVKTHLALKKSKDDITRLLSDIESKNKLITSSIEYAQTIQQALLPDRKYMEQVLPEHFILYRPKDIVSGDFYWVKKIDNTVMLAAVDCTGHGVPGAFMSMLGIAFLNEVVRENGVLRADAILNELRNHVIEALQQKGEPGESKDGMDVALCVIDRKERVLHFAGANNPLYYIRGGEVYEIKGDKMPVAIHVRMDPFSNHTVELLPGDTFYIFSDGYADQFGGPHGKKFKYKALRELLLTIHKKPMSEQKTLLDDTFEKWKGEMEQIDDVVLIGFRV